MTIEQLERREFYSVVPTGNTRVTSRGSLYVTGTVANDRITVTRIGGAVNVIINGFNSGFSGEVKRIFVDAGAGDDRVTIKIARRANLTGSEGNDTLIGGAADDTFDGGAGSNRIYGRGGVNTSLAGKGSNVIFTERVIGETADRVSFADATGGVTLGRGPNVQPLADIDTEASVNSPAGETLLEGESFDVIATAFADSVEIPSWGNINSVDAGDGADTLRGVVGGSRRRETTLRGGAGNDHFLGDDDGQAAAIFGDDGDDLFSASFAEWDGGAGIDTFSHDGAQTDSVYLTLMPNVENVEGTSFIRVIGNGLNNRITLDRYDGPITVDAGGGDDTVVRINRGSVVDLLTHVEHVINQTS